MKLSAHCENYIVTFVTGVLMLFAQELCGQQKSWQHPSSPFRAVFDIKKRAYPAAQCGVVLEVPCFNLGDAEGRDVYCFDDHNRQLKRCAIGRGRRNTCLVMAVPEKDSREISAYFGSGQHAPSVKLEAPVLCEIWSLDGAMLRTLDAVEKTLEKAKFVGRFAVDKISEVVNSLDSREHFIMVFTGNYVANQGGTRSFFIASSDLSYLFIDDKLLIERKTGGTIWGTVRGENHKEIDLKSGLHRIKLITCRQTDGQFGISLGKCTLLDKEVKGVSFVQGNEFIQGGTSVLKNVEARSKNAACPIFWYTHQSYMALDDESLTATELGTFSGQEAEWRFADGVVMKGAKISRIFPKQDSIGVAVSVKKTEAVGRIEFPQAAPEKVASAAKRADFDAYAQMLEKQGINKMDDSRALALILQFLARQDCHDLQVTAAEAYLKSKHPKREEAHLAMTCLARAGSNNGRENPAADKAMNAYEKLLKAADDKAELEQMLCEACEYAIFGLRDFKQAEKLLERYGAKVNAKKRTALTMDLALQSGDLKGTLEAFQSLMEGKRFGEKQRTSAVRGASFEEEAERALQDGRLLDARQALSDWGVEYPLDRGNGSLSLVRSRYFEKRGWLEGAEGELRGAIKADAELPNLPEVEFELAGVLKKQGRADDANALYRKIVDTYPRHPVADKAKELMK